MTERVQTTERARRDRGAVLPLVAILLPVLLVMTAFAVDLGRQRSLRRTMQARADIIALDMIRLADGATEQEILSDPGYAAYLQSSADVNNAGHLLPNDLVVEYGRWDEALGRFDQTLPGDVPSAVLVTAHDELDYFFQPGTGEANRSAIAVRDNDKIGQFSIGSSLARLNTGDSSTLNPLLSGLLGSAINLSALDYQGLAGAYVNVGDLLMADAGAGTVDELLSSEMSMDQFIDLTADALTNRGYIAQANALRNLPVNIPTPEQVSLGDFLNLTSQSGSALNADMNAVDLILAAAQVANGDNFINLNLGIPNLATVRMQVTEPPKMAIGPPGVDGDGNWITQAHAANLRIELLVTVANLNLNVLGLLGVQAAVRVPIVVTGGGASGYLVDVRCDPNPDELDVLTVPRPLSAGIQAVNPPLAVISALVKVLLLDVRLDIARVTAGIDPPLEDPTTLDGEVLPIPVGSIANTAARGLNLGNILDFDDLTITALGVLPLNLGNLGNGLLNVLNPALSAIDNALDPVLQTLGVRIGESDVGAHFAQCGTEGFKLVD